MSTAEQAQIYIAQGSLCRAVALYKRVVAEAPTAENLTMLAEVYAMQGLTENSIALHLQAVKMGIQ